MTFSFNASSFATPSSGGGGFSFGNNNSSGNSQALTTFGSNNNNNNSGGSAFSFGLPASNNSSSSTPSNSFGFGNNTSSTFGSTNNTFGNTSSSNTFGGTTFGNNNSTSFGSTNTNASTSASSFGSPSAFGNFGSNSNSNTFGSNNNSNSFGGGSYKATEVKEGTGPVSSYLHLCCMDQYKIYSSDMTRWQDYKKIGTPTAPTAFGAPSAFGQTNSAPSTNNSTFSFGSATSSTFGAPSTTNNSSGSPFSFGNKPANAGTPSAFSFGNTSAAAPSTFGNTGTTTFGSFSAPSTGFGTPNTNASTPSTFGNFNAPPANSPSQFSFGGNNNNNNNNSNTGSTNSFSFGNNTSNSNTGAPSAFSFSNPTTSTTPTSFGSFSSAPTTSTNSFSFGNNAANKPTFGTTTTPTAFSFNSNASTTQSTQLFNGGFSNNAGNNATQQQIKIEPVMLSDDAYGKLPTVSLPASRTRPLPAPVVKPATPSSASKNYKLTPKSMKRLLIMDSPASPASVDNEQRVLNELLSPQTHVKKLVITDADQQNLSIFESARKVQKAVLKDLSNQKEQNSFSPPPTPYQAPRKLAFSQGPSNEYNKPEVQPETDQNKLRQSAKDNSNPLSNSYKPEPIRITPSGAFFQNPTVNGLGDSTPMGKSRDYNSYTEAVVDNRPEIEIDKSVPVPKCTRNGVVTVPPMDILLRMTKNELMAVEKFTVFKEDVGKVVFPGTTDVRGLDIDRIVSFKDREIVVYPNEIDKPAVGEGLNKQAEITLFKCWPHDKTTNRPTDDPTEIEAFVKKLKRRCRKWHCHFKSYEHGNWTFSLDNFAD